MAASSLDNAAPTVYSVTSERQMADLDFVDDVDDPIDSREVFDIVRNINDPEHPLTLEQLNVTREAHCYIDDAGSHVRVEFTPTIPHCSMATLIGLSIRVKLLRSLPGRFKVDVSVRPGTHMSEVAVNRQLNDKERVAAALENTGLLEVVNQCIAV